VYIVHRVYTECTDINWAVYLTDLQQLTANMHTSGAATNENDNNLALSSQNISHTHSFCLTSVFFYGHRELGNVCY